MTTPLDAHFWNEEEEILWAAIVGLLMESYLDGVSGGVELLPLSVAPLVNFDLINQAAIEFAKQYRFDLISGITDTTRKQVQELTSTWVQSGEPLSVLESQLSPIFGEFRSRMIAQTEITRIFAKANMAAWKSTGFVSGKKWMTSRDDRVCVICEPLDGKVVALENSFFSRIGGGFPSPPAHVNCRCWLQPVVDIEAAIRQVGAILA